VKSIFPGCTSKAAGTENPKGIKFLKNNKKLRPVNRNYRRLKVGTRDGAKTRICARVQETKAVNSPAIKLITALQILTRGLVSNPAKPGN
jgi:hypothetical protein